MCECTLLDIQIGSDRLEIFERFYEWAAQLVSTGLCLTIRKIVLTILF